jgi:vitamin B12 transporter
MPVIAHSRVLARRRLPQILFLILVALGPALCQAASIRGVVTDTTGAKITGAAVVLISNGQEVASAASTADGSFEITTGVSGRFYLLVSAKSFRQVQTPGFYAGRLDSIERTIVLEPEWVRESIVVTATGTPTPQDQTSSATSVLGPIDFEFGDDFVNALRLMPGTFVAQIGQRGSQASLFIRGGDSDDNKVLVDGVSAGDLGGRFDFGPLSTTAQESAEVYRGPNSNLYGADAESGVVSFTTPHGTTSFPSFLFHGDLGSFWTSGEELEAAGTYNKLDYLGAFSWMQTGNDVPNDEYHVATTSANLGYQLNGSTQLRATLHYGVDGTGVPNAWDFYRVADQATQKDQDILMSASVDNQTTAAFHNTFRYGLTRKREQYSLWTGSGSGVLDAFGDTTGEELTIAGANGYSATGRAVLDYNSGTLSQPVYAYSSQLVSNRDQFMYQGSYAFTPHITALIGMHYEDERGQEYIPTYSLLEKVERENYDYLASVHGDYKNRFFYTLGGSLEHYSLFGTETSPRAGLSFYVLKPCNGIFSGTRILGNFGDAVREPSLTDQTGSLYDVLASAKELSAIQELHITPLGAPTARTYEAGGEQTFFSSRLVLRASYFHNEFGRQIESVPARQLPNLIPGLTPAEKIDLEDALGYFYAYNYGLSVNTEAFRAQGIESTVEGGIGRNIFLRGGYTYLDAVVQRSFDSDNAAYFGGAAPTFNGIPIGALSPLWGARPFRRPPHTGFISGSYVQRKYSVVFTSAFASRSDDSTFLEYQDVNGGNSLLLPNRNLDFGYARIDIGGSYQLLDWLGLYGQAENLADNQHISPIGFPSLPATLRVGARLQWGKGSGR